MCIFYIQKVSKNSSLKVCCHLPQEPVSTSTSYMYAHRCYGDIDLCLHSNWTTTTEKREEVRDPTVILFLCCALGSSQLLRTTNRITRNEREKKCIRPNMNNCYWTNWNDETTAGNNGEHDDEYQSYTDEQRDRSLPYLLELSWSIHHHQDTTAQYQVRNIKLVVR